MATLFQSTESQAPPLGLLLREVRQIASWRRAAPAAPIVEAVGQGRPVLVIPGFLASDGSTRPLRQALRQAGFKVRGWGQGRNFGLRGDVMGMIDARVRELEARYGGPVSIVGWSLGGLIAREYAKIEPDRVDRVVTLGSPFSGDLRSNNAWRLYELVARHKIDELPIACDIKAKPPVETVAIWSRRDGVIAASSARGLPGERDRAIEVSCGHIEMSFAPEAQRAVITALA